MKKKIFYTAIALLVLVGLACIFYYYRSLSNMDIFRNQISIANNALSAKNYDLSIDTGNAALKNSTTPAQKGQALLTLAEALWARNQGDDQSQALTYYKQIAEDETMPPVRRALALNDISIVVTMHSLSYYQTNFTEAPYDTFVPSSGSDSAKVRGAYLNVLKLSDSIYPTSFAEYAIAGNYYAPLIMAGTPGMGTPEEVAKEMQAYIAAGDTRNDQSLYSPTPLLSEYLYKAIALGRAGIILNLDNSTQVEQAYQLALQNGNTLYQNAPSDSIYTLMMITRFFYAKYLNEYFPKQRTADIVSVLQPFSTTPTNLSNAVITAFKNSFLGSGYLKSSASELAKISPDFQKMLARLTSS